MPVEFVDNAPISAGIPSIVLLENAEILPEVPVSEVDDPAAGFSTPPIIIADEDTVGYEEEEGSVLSTGTVKTHQLLPDVDDDDLAKGIKSVIKFKWSVRTE